jgi:NAD(P)-dependent dehydrogenase (short-subunit alcohol dehydrogenase family)
MSGRLAGKTALVLGATSGMGRATALLFAREGAKLALAGRRAGLLQELGEQIAEETGQTTLGLTCDVRDREQVAATLSAAHAHLGRIDTLIYASGTNTPDRALTRLTPEIWEELIGTNLTGAYHATQLALPYFREQKDGLIIYLSSISGKWADASGAAYQASKQGLNGLAGATMLEEKEHGIRTSIIYPGLTITPLLEKRPAPTAKELLDKALLPEDVADSCLYIASLPPRCHVPELVLRPALP